MGPHGLLPFGKINQLFMKKFEFTDFPKRKSVNSGLCMNNLSFYPVEVVDFSQFAIVPTTKNHTVCRGNSCDYFFSYVTISTVLYKYVGI